MFSVGLFARCKQDLGRSPGRDLENGSVRIRILVGGGLLLVFRSQHDGGDARCPRMEDFRGTFRILLLLLFFCRVDCLHWNLRGQYNVIGSQGGGLVS